MLQRFLSVADANRASQTLRKLAQHNIHAWALTGGLAVEIHCLRRGCQPSVRALNDIDFIAESFDAIPESLGEDFLFRHIHPYDPPNKTMLQLVDSESKLRIDVFRSGGDTLCRRYDLDLSGSLIKVISLEDLTARTARLALDLADGVPTPSKHATDFLRLADLVDSAAVEAAWVDHRRPGHPFTFKKARDLLYNFISARQDILITPEYSKNANEVCLRCRSIRGFRLADPKVVLSLLGYC